MSETVLISDAVERFRRVPGAKVVMAMDVGTPPGSFVIATTADISERRLTEYLLELLANRLTPPVAAIVSGYVAAARARADSPQRRIRHPDSTGAARGQGVNMVFRPLAIAAHQVRALPNGSSKLSAALVRPFVAPLRAGKSLGKASPHSAAAAPLPIPPAGTS